MRRTIVVIGLGLSAALLTSGCQSAGGGGDANSTNATGDQQAQAAPTGSPESLPGTPPVREQMTMPIPGQTGQTVTIGYSSLKVVGQLAELTLTWTPHGIGTDTDDMEDMMGVSTGFSVNLIDKANLKRYAVVSDSSDHDLHTDMIDVDTGNDQPLTSTWWFAAPPANADLDVTISDRPIFESVPVTR